MFLLMFPFAFSDFGLASLIGGSPDFTGCLDSASCSSGFYSFLTHSMMEQGFMIQSQNVMGTTLLNDKEWWFSGVSPNLHSGISFEVDNRSRKVVGVSICVQIPVQHREGKWGKYCTLSVQSSYGI